MNVLMCVACTPNLHTRIHTFMWLYHYMWLCGCYWARSRSNSPHRRYVFSHAFMRWLFLSVSLKTHNSVCVLNTNWLMLLTYQSPISPHQVPVRPLCCRTTDHHFFLDVVRSERRGIFGCRDAHPPRARARAWAAATTRGTRGGPRHTRPKRGPVVRC